MQYFSNGTPLETHSDGSSGDESSLTQKVSQNPARQQFLGAEQEKSYKINEDDEEYNEHQHSFDLPSKKNTLNQFGGDPKKPLHKKSGLGEAANITFENSHEVDIESSRPKPWSVAPNKPFVIKEVGQTFQSLGQKNSIIGEDDEEKRLPWDPTNLGPNDNFLPLINDPTSTDRLKETFREKRDVSQFRSSEAMNQFVGSPLTKRATMRPTFTAVGNRDYASEYVK